jgi:heme-degrading monooxygenase HmoA
MVARVTLAEIDTVRMSLEQAVARFEELILPELRELDGYEGVYVLATPDGRALVMTLWENEEAARREIDSGFYRSQVEKFVTIYRSPPGRETYDVLVADEPALTG